MKRMARTAVFALPRLCGRCAAAMLTMVACAPDSSFGPPIERGNELIHTDAIAYVATLQGGSGTYKRYGTHIVATFTNRMAMPIWLERCFPSSPQPMYHIEYDGQQNGADIGAAPMYSHAHACVGHDQQFRIEPGAQRTDTLDVSGPNAWQNGQPLGRAEGRMRVAYYASVCRPNVYCLGVAVDARSHPFDMRISR